MRLCVWFHAVPLFFFIVMSLVLTACSSRTTSDIKTYDLGDKAQAGALIYNVFETQWLSQLGEGPKARIPAQRFFLVRLSIVNSGSSESAIPTLVLVADDGQSYPELLEGEGVPQWIGFLRSVKPAETEQGNIIFDVPPSHYKLRVSDEYEQKAALIDIPLHFGSDAANVTAPQK